MATKKKNTDSSAVQNRDAQEAQRYSVIEPQKNAQGKSKSTRRQSTKSSSAPAEGKAKSGAKKSSSSVATGSKKKESTASKSKSGKKSTTASSRTRSKQAIETANAAVETSMQKSASKTASKKKGGRKKTASAANDAKVRITFIGGLNEIGKNITMYECGDDAILVDCGMAFPDDGMLGIDLVIPDFTYVTKNANKIRGIVLTHGHEDHIGSLPYLLKNINIPVYGTRLTLGLVESKLREHGILGTSTLNTVYPGSTISLGCFDIEFIGVNHSIPDAVAMAIHTPAGVIVQTGDFKIDATPVYGDMIDLGRFAQLGKEGVLCLLSDSTNAERAGYTMSERKVGESFNTLFQSASATSKRIIIATFASNIQRIQQIIDCAARFGRKVAVSGRSMINAVAIASELGYLNVPDGLLIDIAMINRYPKDQIVLITTGSQGEPMSALSRMAFADHRQVAIGPDDFIIISATPIPGNEKTVGNVVNELLRHGCEVVYEKMYDVHVSGHACQEELKILLSLVKPQYFIPVHGEHKHLKKHAGLALQVGIAPENVLIAELGDSVELSEKSIRVVDRVPAGRVLVDGLGVGDVGSVVLRDRKHLGEDGLIIAVAAINSAEGYIVSGPDVVSRGFVYVRDAEPLMEQARAIVRDTLEKCLDRGVRDWSTMKTRVRDELSHYIYEISKRSPMILPVIMDV